MGSCERVVTRICDEWGRQMEILETGRAKLIQRYGITDFISIGPEEGYEFKVDSVQFSAAWTSEVYDVNGETVEDQMWDCDAKTYRPRTLTPAEDRAVQFATELTGLLEGCYIAVRHCVKEFGWSHYDDDYDGEVFHNDAYSFHIIAPYWSRNPDLVMRI
jgi:hypothetical protein